MTREENIENIEMLNILIDNAKEKTLAEIITKYDFIVGSKECKYRLMEILPEGVNVIYTPYIDDPTKIYVMKKFDIMDFLFEPQESEE